MITKTIIKKETITKLSKTEKIVLRRIIHINKTTLCAATFDDFKNGFELDGNTYEPITSSRFKKYVNILLRKGFIITSPLRSRPQSYYTKEYEHLHRTVTNNTIGTEKQEQNSNYSQARDVSDILEYGVHDILFCPSVKDSHQAFINYGCQENIKKIIKVGVFTINNLKFTVRSSSHDTLIIHVANSRNQIILNSQEHLNQFNDALDKLIEIIASTYYINNIPHHDNWIIKQWHYGLDYNDASLEKFHVTFKDVKNIFHRIYTKCLPTTNTRMEVQEQPNLTKKLAIMVKTKG